MTLQELLADPVVSESMQSLDSWLGEVFEGFSSPVAEYAGVSVTSGGKRMRPLLLFLVAGEQTVTSATVRAAGAVELLHNATLVHDDVLDAADLRRGEPTVVAAHGRKAAVATGDLMFALAFRELARNGSVEQVAALSSASSSLAAGELMQRQDAWDLSVTPERYFQRCRLKTAALFIAACELGRLCSTDTTVELKEFGSLIGLAFQLFDDVLDVVGVQSLSGKSIGTDLLDGTVNLPLILALKRSKELAELDLRSLQTTADSAAVCGLIESSGAVDAVRAQALEFVAEAKALVDDLGDRQLRDRLMLVADSVVDRYA